VSKTTTGYETEQNLRRVPIHPTDQVARWRLLYVSLVVYTNCIRWFYNSFLELLSTVF
jgi:hypothetical protein